MSVLLELVAAALVLLGAGFALIGSIGLARLPDFFTRLHGPTKATTLGVGAILLGSMFYFGSQQQLSLQELLVSLFLFLTAPVSAYMLSRAALHRGCRSLAPPPHADDEHSGPTHSRNPGNRGE
jgi:multicomponent K+:H+ antiporter subunit G